MPENRSQSLASAFHCAGRGIVHTLVTQRNMQVQAAVAAAVVLAGLALRLDGSEWVAVVLCITLVVVTELLNTALEAAVNLASPEYHDWARQAKDAAAGASLVASAGSVVVGLIIFVPRLLAVLGR